MSRLPVLNQAVADEAAGLSRYVSDIRRLQEVVDSWDDENQKNTVSALLSSIEELHKEAFVRMIRTVKTDPSGAQRLREAVQDEVVYAVLRRLGVLKPSLPERLDRALMSVRPMLGQHGGDVELVSVDSNHAVTIRLLGACDGCPASGLTLREGVEKAIRAECPEVDTISVARGSGLTTANNVSFVSPFARAEDSGWRDIGDLSTVPAARLVTAEVEGRSIILWRSNGEAIAAYDNMCAHLGMPLAEGRVSDGIVTCPHHGFQFLLESGECLTAPEAQLVTHAVRVIDGRVEVKIS